MPNLFGIDIAGIVKSNIAPGLRPATLTRYAAGTRTPGSLTSGTNATTTSYPCRGLVSSYADNQIDGTKIQKGDKKVLLIAKTLPAGVAPLADDVVAVDGATVGTIVNVKADPAGATWGLQVRGG